MKMITIFTIFALILLQTACGPSIEDVLKKYDPQFREKRTQFKKIADSLPPKGSLDSNLACREVSPGILLDEKNNQFNAEALMFEQLIDPDANPEMDFMINGDLINALKWTGPKNPLSDSVKGNNGADMERNLLSALDYRYLIVNRIKDLINPSVIDEKTYKQGQIATETFVVDLTNNKTICGFTTTAKSLEDITQVPLDTSSTTTTTRTRSGTKTTTHSPASVIEQLRKAVKSSLWENARNKVVEELRNSTNAIINSSGS